MARYVSWKPSITTYTVSPSATVVESRCRFGLSQECLWKCTVTEQSVGAHEPKLLLWFVNNFVHGSGYLLATFLSVPMSYKYKTRSREMTVSHHPTLQGAIAVAMPELGNVGRNGNPIGI